MNFEESFLHVILMKHTKMPSAGIVFLLISALSAARAIEVFRQAGSA